MALSIILLVFSLVLSALAGVGPFDDPNPWRGRLLCYAVACLAAALLFEKAAPLLH
jgi:hypothetical protein